MLTPDALTRELQALQAGTHRPVNLNFFCHAPPEEDAARDAAWREALAPFYAEAGLDINAMSSGAGRVPFSHAVADGIEPFRPAVVSFHFGLPAPDLLARVKAWGSKVLASATTVEEALWLEAHGADAVIAQGLEAGGHRGMFLSDDVSTQIGTFALLPQIVAAVKLPVIAAGGIASAAGVRAAMALGASGVQVGTAYLCSFEATTSALHRQALQSPAARHTDAHQRVQRPPGARHRQPRGARTGRHVPGRPGLPAGHRRHRTAARPLGSPGQRRFFSAVGRSERLGLPAAARRRHHP